MHTNDFLPFSVTKNSIMYMYITLKFCFTHKLNYVQSSTLKKFICYEKHNLAYAYTGLKINIKRTLMNVF